MNTQATRGSRDHPPPSFLRFAALIAAVLAAAQSTAFAATFSSHRSLMGTRVEIVLCGPDRTALEEAAARGYAELERLERDLSVWKEDSQVSRINRLAGVEPVVVDRALFELIRDSVGVSRISGGSFDITVEPLVRLWDFRRPDFRPPDPESIRKALEAVDYRRILLNETVPSVFLERKGMRITLGGVAKGYAADRASEVVRASGVAGGVVKAGGDLRAFGRKENGEVWKVGVANPRDKQRVMCVIPVSDAAVSTSGDYERFRMVDGVRYHHILNPRTGTSASQCMSATVIAGSGTVADALATAVFVLGPEEGMGLIERLPGVEGVIIDAAGRLSSSSGIPVIVAPRESGRSKSEDGGPMPTGIPVIVAPREPPATP